MQEGLISKLSAGAQAGRATAAEKQIEKMRSEGLIERPFVPKRRSFTFPSAERMGKMVLSIDNLTHGYQQRTLFKNAQLELEKGDRLAIIGKTVEITLLEVFSFTSTRVQSLEAPLSKR